jgi:hypothetical protein
MRYPDTMKELESHIDAVNIEL